MTFILTYLEVQMTLTFKHVSLECKHVVQVFETSVFIQFDIDLNPMTLVLDIDLDIVKTYVYTEESAVQKI